MIVIHGQYQHFNTSHVNVNLISIPYLYNALDISIHLMLMLILNSLLKKLKKPWNFNTSHVNVNQAALQVVRVVYRYFNTSHVNVNPSVCAPGAK